MNNRMVVMTFHDVAPDELEKLHKAFVELGDEVGRSRNFNVIDPTTDGTSMKTTCFAGSKPLGVADVNEVGMSRRCILGQCHNQRRRVPRFD